MADDYPPEAVAELAERLRAAETAIATLADEVRSLRARLPPEGWELNNYANVKSPWLSVARDCRTGEWSLYDSSAMVDVLATGTLDEVTRGR